MNRTSVNSSNIASIGYDQSNSILEIEFNNTRIYHYYNVPMSEYKNLMSASSHGRYLAQNIIDNYRCSEQ